MASAPQPEPEPAGYEGDDYEFDDRPRLDAQGRPLMTNTPNFASHGPAFSPRPKRQKPLLPDPTKPARLAAPQHPQAPEPTHNQAPVQGYEQSQSQNQIQNQDQAPQSQADPQLQVDPQFRQHYQNPASQPFFDQDQPEAAPYQQPYQQPYPQPQPYQQAYDHTYAPNQDQDDDDDYEDDDYEGDEYGNARSQRFKRLGKLVTPETKGLFLYNFYQAKELVTSPTNFFRTLPPPGNIAEPAIFLLIMTIAGGLLAGITRANLLITIGFVVANLIGATFSAFAMWKLYVMSGSQRSFEENFRVVAYSQVTLLLAALQAPLLGVITGLLAFIGTVYIQIQGMTQIHDLPRNKIIAILIGISLFLAIIHVKLGL